MPTYKNTSQTSIAGVFDTDKVHRTISPNKTVETYRYYDWDNLVKTSDTPYFNPVLSVTNLTLSDSADSKQIIISENCKKIEIINTSDYLLYLYYQSTTNTPATIISAGTTFNIEDEFRRFTRIFLKASDTIITDKVFISQMFNYSFIY